MRRFKKGGRKSIDRYRYNENVVVSGGKARGT